MENQIERVNEYMKISEKMLNTNEPARQTTTNLSEIAKILKNRNQKYATNQKVTNPEILNLHEKLKKETWITEIKKTDA